MIWLYCIISICILLLCIKAYIRIQHPFWSSQPIFHVYDILYYFKPFTFIYGRDTPFTFHKTYIDYSIQIESKASDKTLREFVSFIQEQYMKTKASHYNPSKESLELALTSYFTNFPCYIAYKTMYNDNNPLGMYCCLTSRPIYVHMNDKQYIGNYVDYLCVHKDYRKQGHTEKLIYTYACHAKQDSGINLFVFKKEYGSHTCIQPLVEYTSFVYDIRDWNSISMDITPMKFEEIHINSFQMIHEYIQSISSFFDCTLISSLEYILKSIEIQDIHIYVLRHDDKVYGLYFFRNAYTTYEEDDEKHEIIECIGSICFQEEAKTMITDVFINIVCMIREKYKMSFLVLDILSHNFIIKEHLLYDYKVESTSSYYLYNYICKTYDPSQLFICI